MAYNDFMNQAMGFGPQAFETEEERRKRLEQEANAEVQTQTVKTYADGSREAITKTQIPTAPVAPDQVFNRQLQVESGGQHYAPSGQILTSPKGAVGVAQIMPSTAANPGFGIKPITPEELSTPEGNQAFGLRYKQGMLDAFGGDQEKATAAYNAGPGRVQQAVATATQQGGSWKDYIPKETQNYLQKVLGGALDVMVPSAQAAEVPPPAQRPATTTAPGQYVNLANSAGPTVPYQAPKAEVPPAPVAPGQEQFNVPPAQAQMGPPPSAAPSFADRFVQAQKDPAKLAAIASDETETPAIRQLARDMFYQQETARRDLEATKDRTRQALETGNTNQIARDLRNPDGSMLKYWFYKSAGWDEAAKQEADKLGFSDIWQQTTLPNGTQVAVRFGADGTAKSGIDAKGNSLTQSDLDTLHGMGGGALGKNIDVVGGTYINDKTGEVGRVVTNKATGQSYVQTDKGRRSMEGFRPQSSTGSMDSYRQKLALEAQSKFSTMTAQQRLDVWKNASTQSVNAGGQPFTLQEMGLNPDGTLISQTTGGTTVQPAAPTTLVTSSGQPATPANTGLNANQLEAQKNARGEIAKEAAKVVGDAANILGKAERSQAAIDIIDSGEHNLGPQLGILTGKTILPGERQIGGMLGTTDSANTKRVMAVVKELGAAGIKVLGANPTDTDLRYLTENQPNESWAPEETKKWIEDARRAIERGLKIANKQVETGGSYVPTIEESTGKKPGTEKGGIKIIKREKI